VAAQQPTSSLLGNPAFKTGDFYSKSVVQNNVKWSYGVKNTKAETQLAYSKIYTASVSYDPVASGFKVELARQLDSNKTLAITHSNVGDIVGIKMSF
jgi:hypothetical protein